MDILTDTEIRAALEGMPGWDARGAAIATDYRFDSFRDAIAFVDRVADLAEEAGHHPDLQISYDRVGVQLTTHSAGGVTDKDLGLARQIDETAR